ncbi:MAG: phosphoribosyl-AMP cyclohydrolase [Deltaproteobacteria bacterium]|nr:phosphoribosyl-AMP cyclohydrolase [Deltaproteobacteria bacterium]MBN2671935.1 phosphoribosyl-AMP cyclohydrolase [Deltaproteobacteria bacterium]
MKLNFDKLGNGLLPAIVQDYETGKVLMVAFMNQESFDMTVKTKKATYYSRSRDQLWVKGESSGNIQEVKEIYVDCDEDTVLVKVNQIGDAACHKGYNSCFFRKLNDDGELEVVEELVFDPKQVYKK